MLAAAVSRSHKRFRRIPSTYFIWWNMFFITNHDMALNKTRADWRDDNRRCLCRRCQLTTTLANSIISLFHVPAKNFQLICCATPRPAPSFWQKLFTIPIHMMVIARCLMVSDCIILPTWLGCSGGCVTVGKRISSWSVFAVDREILVYGNLASLCARIIIITIAITNSRQCQSGCNHGNHKNGNLKWFVRVMTIVPLAEVRVVGEPVPGTGREHCTMAANAFVFRAVKVLAVFFIVRNKWIFNFCPFSCWRRRSRCKSSGLCEFARTR